MFFFSSMVEVILVARLVGLARQAISFWVLQQRIFMSTSQKRQFASRRGSPERRVSVAVLCLWAQFAFGSGLLRIRFDVTVWRKQELTQTRDSFGPLLSHPLLGIPSKNQDYYLSTSLFQYLSCHCVWSTWERESRKCRFKRMPNVLLAISPYVRKLME